MLNFIIAIIILITICLDVSLYSTEHFNDLILGYNYTLSVGFMNLMSVINVLLMAKFRSLLSLLKQKEKEKLLSDHLIE